MGAANLLSAAASSVKLVATIVFLERGLGVRGLVFANAAVVLVLGCLTIIATFRVYPSLRLAPRHVSRATFASLFAFGWRTQFARLANLVMFETDVLVIALLLRNLELAALYRIGVELANKFRQAPGILVSALIPAAADFHARGETDTLRKLYIRATKYSAAIAIPLAAFGAGAAGPLLETWLGPIAGLTTAAGVLQVIVVGYIANIVPGAGVSIALGMGRADLQLRAGLISMFANVGLTIVLALSIGFWGIPLATAVSMAISWAWYGHAMGRLLDVPWMRMWTDALKWPCAVGVCTLVAVAAVVGVAGPIDGRMANGAIACGCALAGAAIVLAAMRWSPMLDDYDRSVFRRALDLPGEWMWKRMPRPG